MKSHAQQTKDYKEMQKVNKPKNFIYKVGNGKPDRKQFNWTKLVNAIKRYVAVIVLAGGTVRMLYLEADNKLIVIGFGMVAVLYLINAALSKD